MLTKDVAIEGFTTADWVRLSEVVPRAPSPRDGRGGVVALVDGGRVLKLVSTVTGRLDPTDTDWPVALDRLAHRFGASWAARLHVDALEELLERFAERLRREDAWLDQMLLLAALVRELGADGMLDVWPWRPAAWPIPSVGVAERALDLICPDGRVLAIGVFREGAVHTCAAVRRMGPGFDRVVGPADLRGEMGLVSGDWSRDYRHLARAIEERVGPLSLGCFGEVATFQRLASDPAPGAWAAAVAARDVVLSPLSPAAAIPLGVDLGRVAWSTLKDLADRMGGASLLSRHGPLGPAFDRVRKTALGDRDLVEVLGFDPMELLRWLGRARGPS